MRYLVCYMQKVYSAIFTSCSLITYRCPSTLPWCKSQFMDAGSLILWRRGITLTVLHGSFGSFTIYMYDIFVFQDYLSSGNLLFWTKIHVAQRNEGDDLFKRIGEDFLFNTFFLFLLVNVRGGHVRHIW